MKPLSLLSLAVLVVIAGSAQAQTSAIDRYVMEAQSEQSAAAFTPGSLYTPSAILADLGRDLRAVQVNDVVTIIVSDRASALARGTASANRKSSARAGIGALAGPTRAAGPLANLSQLGSEQQLEGQGETTRETVLTTTLAARVTHVLPNGSLVIEGSKDVQVNSERQLVSVRGVARWNDVGPGNTIRSDRLAHLEIRVHGKGVIGDAIRRPHLLYRVLLGLWPF
jgi:flagellar L-ring protein precursor FlgH